MVGVPLVFCPLTEVEVLPNGPPPLANVSAAVSGSEEPMQICRSRLTPQKRRRWMTQRLCIYCGQEGHFLACCPEVPGNRGTLMSHTLTSPSTVDWIPLRGVLCVANDSLPVHAFVDSGADRNFIDENFKRSHCSD